MHQSGTWFRGNTTVASTSLLLLDTDSQPATSLCDSVRPQRNEEEVVTGWGEPRQGPWFCVGKPGRHELLPSF